MKRINKLIKVLRGVMRHPHLLNCIADHNLLWKEYVEKRYGKGMQLPVVDLPDIITTSRKEIPVVSFLGGSSLPTDFLLLMNLAASFEQCSYFEIGTWRGESVSNVAQVAKECFTLNLPHQSLKAMGFSDDYVAQIGIFSSQHPNVIQLWGNSLEFDFAALNRRFDLIFIDGDHHYDVVKNDTAKVFNHLVHDNTIVVWHDYAINPEEIRYEVFAGILDALPSHLHKHLFHVTNTLSAVFIRKDLPVSDYRYYSTPHHYFKVTLETIALK